ncbi:hypothetical protein MPSEU_001007300 [Mayamaea pseudoterrestris]|nr:hypothetical protein MPSEU_001007300 [Mayamaea pseudoterrestris]
MAMRVPPEHFADLGNEIMARRGRGVSSRTDRRFRATFGTTPALCSTLWMRLDPSRTMHQKAEPKHLLWSLMLLKLYLCEHALAALVGGVDEKTVAKWSWLFIDKISSLENQIIRWENRFDDDIGNDCLVSVDGTDFRIQQFRPFWKGWYSHKFHGPGVRWEVALCIRTGHIVWIIGPFPCGEWPDIKIFRHALKNMLQQGERVEADDGYAGECPQFVVAPARFAEGAARVAATTQVRARHETVNKRFKQWGCLKQVFRHELSKQSLVFRAVAVITQLAIENGEPLFAVAYDV